ncbi:hypothetical protein HRED_10547 [Candidatus Haloredivivus sp. G17]|nr:hypothetical protein HRED_10547 [Candidatus Haloredivivus sp. G17]
MVEFETIEKERRDYGNFPGEKFIELSRNKAIQEDGSENSFIQIATGYYQDEEPKYKKRFWQFSWRLIPVLLPRNFLYLMDLYLGFTG